MTRKYNKPPVVEAVCEFRFESSQPWDLTLPGLLYEQVKVEFPTVEQANLVQVTLDVGGNQLAQQVQNAVRFSTQDKSEFLQVAPHVLSIHQLPPYRNWEHFKLRIVTALTTYQKLIQASSFVRIGLRYINRVELPPGRHELDDYFRFMPKVPEPIPQLFQTFLAQVQIPYGDTPESPESFLRLSIGAAPPNIPGYYAVVLDLDMYTPDANVPSPDETPDWLERAHQRLEEAFDNSLTEKAHTEVFEEVKH